MLTEEQIYQNKLAYLNLLFKLNVDVTSLTAYLDSVDYFNKPLNAQAVQSQRGSLCQYALDLYYELAQLVNAYVPGRYTEADVIKVALFKDLYRAELYEFGTKNVKNNQTGQWEETETVKYRENRPVFGDIYFGSYMVAKNFIEFSDEQIEAILQAQTKDSYAGDIHTILRAYPLAALTKMADIAATYLASSITA